MRKIVYKLLLTLNLLTIIYMWPVALVSSVGKFSGADEAKACSLLGSGALFSFPATSERWVLSSGLPVGGQCRLWGTGEKSSLEKSRDLGTSSCVFSDI